MAFTLPNPTTPQDGQPGDAVPILANFTAIAQAIASFDGSQINAGSVTESALATNIDPVIRFSDGFSNYVVTGCIWSSVSGLQGTMTGGTIYVNGIRLIINGVGSQTFGANQDTYVDIDKNGNVNYNPVSNNAASPSLAANNMRVAKVITGASTITSIVQSGYDSNFVLIYNKSPLAPTVANSIQSATNSGGAGGTFNYLNFGGLKFLWGSCSNSVSGSNFQISANLVITFPSNFFNTILFSSANAQNFGGGTAYMGANWISAVTVTGGTLLLLQFSGTNGAATVAYQVVGT